MRSKKMSKKFQPLSKILLSLLIITGFALGNEHEGWHEFDNGLSISAEETKPVFIDFYTDWCHWCKVLDEKTFSDTEVKNYMDEHFVKIKVNAEDQTDEQTFNGHTMNSAQLARAFGVTGYPALAFLDKNQNLITLVPGFLPPEKFIHVLKYMKEECYAQKVTFEEYLEKGCNKQ